MNSDAENEEVSSVKLTYYGHACFLLESDRTSILIDPFNEQAGYPFPDVRPAAVVVSHEHFDHNHVQVAKGSPKVIRGLRDAGRDWAEIREQVGPVAITTVRTYHDPTQGSQRGKNAVLIFEGEGLRVVHAGDLGTQTLTTAVARSSGRAIAAPREFPGLPDCPTAGPRSVWLAVLGLGE